MLAVLLFGLGLGHWLGIGDARDLMERSLDITGCGGLDNGRVHGVKIGDGLFGLVGLGNWHTLCSEGQVS